MADSIILDDLPQFIHPVNRNTTIRNDKSDELTVQLDSAVAQIHLLLSADAEILSKSLGFSHVKEITQLAKRLDDALERCRICLTDGGIWPPCCNFALCPLCVQRAIAVDPSCPHCRNTEVFPAWVEAEGLQPILQLESDEVAEPAPHSESVNQDHPVHRNPIYVLESDSVADLESNSQLSSSHRAEDSGLIHQSENIVQRRRPRGSDENEMDEPNNSIGPVVRRQRINRSGAASDRNSQKILEFQLALDQAHRAYDELKVATNGEFQSLDERLYELGVDWIGIAQPGTPFSDVRGGMQEVLRIDQVLHDWNGVDIRLRARAGNLFTQLYNWFTVERANGPVQIVLFADSVIQVSSWKEFLQKVYGKNDCAVRKLRQFAGMCDETPYLLELRLSWNSIKDDLVRLKQAIQVHTASYPI